MGSAGPCPRRDCYVAVTFGIWKAAAKGFLPVSRLRAEKPRPRYGANCAQIAGLPATARGFALPLLPAFVVWLSPLVTQVRPAVYPRDRDQDSNLDRICPRLV